MRRIILILSVICMSGASRILGLFPYPSYSHQVVYRAVTLELAKRGHELVIFTTDPVNDPNLTNYTEVDLRYLYKDLVETINFFEIRYDIPLFLNSVSIFGDKVSGDLLTHPKIQKIIDPNNPEKFDLIVCACLIWDAMYVLAEKLDVPIIGISSLPLTTSHKMLFGNPLEIAFVPDPMTGFTDNMNFWQRIHNLYLITYLYYFGEYKNPWRQQAVMTKYFGNDVPNVWELRSRISMLFVYDHPFFTYPHAKVPAILQIGGLRLAQGKDGAMPSKDLQEIMDNANDGFIYFSLGTNLKSTSMPKEAMNIFLEIFGELPYKIIWKFDADNIANKSDNIIIRKWMPQQAILGHPNVRLFLFQGGLQSMEEAIEFKVPTIAFPVFSDQVFNVRRLLTFGVTKEFDIMTLEKEALKKAILEVATNSSYKENMIKLHDLLHDTPYNVREQVVWWTEHVIRHKGLGHLQTKGRDMPYYQLWYLDFVLLLLVSFTILVCLGLFLVGIVLRFISRSSSNEPIRKKTQ